MGIKELKQKLEADFYSLPLRERCDRDSYLYILLFEILPNCNTLPELLHKVEEFDEEHDENLLTFLYNNYL